MKNKRKVKDPPIKGEIFLNEKKKKEQEEEEEKRRKTKIVL